MTASGAGPSPSGLLREELIQCAAAGMSGTLRVSGEPGGTIHLAGGMVAAIETPGAPGPEVVLLRSRRVTESRWDAAFAASAAGGRPMYAELVTRAALGAGELEALLRTALADAMFVLASGVIKECHAEPGAVDYLLPLEPGATADYLLAEASRRMEVLTAMDVAVAPDRERVVAVPGAVRPGAKLGRGQDEILALADGRRTPRDMAFTLGRGVYATLLQLARMRAAGVLTTTATLATSDEATLSRRLAAISRRVAGTEQPRIMVTEQPRTMAGLPVRRRGRSSQPRQTGEPDTAVEPPAPHRLLQPRSDGPRSDRPSSDGPATSDLTT
jgi:hypothetical protein